MSHSKIFLAASVQCSVQNQNFCLTFCKWSPKLYSDSICSVWVQIFNEQEINMVVVKSFCCICINVAMAPSEPRRPIFLIRCILVQPKSSHVHSICTCTLMGCPILPLHCFETDEDVRESLWIPRFTDITMEHSFKMSAQKYMKLVIWYM